MQSVIMCIYQMVQLSMTLMSNCP